jgi:undecaprenyl pyrophosphate phosphatase UppP
LDLNQAIWLGVLQGITEFLPISSSAHLILMRYWFSWEITDPQVELMFDVALHAGTLMAILLYFWRDLVRLAGAFFDRALERSVERRLAWGILIGFSFLLATPITFGAALWSFRHLLKTGVPDGMGVPMVAGALTAMVVGWLAIAFLLSYLRTRSLLPFVVYRVGVGVATLVRMALVGLQ